MLHARLQRIKQFKLLIVGVPVLISKYCLDLLSSSNAKSCAAKTVFRVDMFGLPIRLFVDEMAHILMLEDLLISMTS